MFLLLLGEKAGMRAGVNSLLGEPRRELPFDLFVRHGLTSIRSIQSFADCREKPHSFSDCFHAGILGQTLDGFQSKLLIAHATTVHQRLAKGNGAPPACRAEIRHPGEESGDGVRRWDIYLPFS